MVGMQVISSAEMQACDRATTEQFGVPSLELMRAASTAVAVFAREQFPRVRRVTVLCGKGNNGGDGMMVAALLAKSGLDVSTLLLGSHYELKGDAAAAWRELGLAPHRSIQQLENAADFKLHTNLLQADLIVDAVLGTGFKPPLRGLALAALEWLKGSPAEILSVDLPSGWPADETSATVADPVFPSDAVVTFTAPKPAHVFGQLTRRWGQPVVVAHIGSPEAAIVSSQRLIWAGSAHTLVEQSRIADANKGKYGHVLVVGGSVGKAGAPAMASLTALRAGAGLVTVAVPSPVLPLVSGFAPELMTWPLAASAGQISTKGLTAPQFSKLIAQKTVVAIGPGLGEGAGTAKLVSSVLSDTDIPTVIDADALNAIATHPQLLSKLVEAAKAGRTIVLTPHPGEMARLTGKSVAEIQANRLEAARSFACEYGVTMVLKGSRTLIAHPDGSAAVNTTGNPAMAKAGSGDMLTGFIAGLLAQFKNDVGHAVEVAVYLHGMAADFAVRDSDEHTLLATDTLNYSSKAFRFRPFRFYRGAPRGYVWLQGLPAAAVPATRSQEAAE